MGARAAYLPCRRQSSITPSLGVGSIMAKKDALVGHCGPDSSFLRITVSRAERDVQVVSVDDDAVVLIDRERRGAFGRVEHPLHETLHGGDVHCGIGIGTLVVELLDAEYIGKGLQALHPRVLERVRRLLAEGRAIDEEEDQVLLHLVDCLF